VDADGFFETGEHFAIDLPGARALFTTRRGGVSGGPYASLNLGRLTDDRSDDVERNRAVLEAELGMPLSYIRQVHGTRVRRVDEPTRPGPGIPEADGQATSVRGVAMMVMVADCLPIALAGHGAVAMLHGGWRGLAGGIVAEGVRAVRELAGEQAPLSAAIGPGIRGCCYEVGDEVRAAFARHPDALDGRHLDLACVARRELEAAGVSEVHDAGLCTACHPELFFSHRRDRGVTGRQAGVAWRRG
jgi:YfiH family protein